MKIEHLLITRFSYRNYTNGNGRSPQYDSDPLDPEKLEFRFLIFEMICLPNILAQVNKDFTWVFIIDEHLAQEYRDKLFELTKSLKNVYLYEFKNEDQFSLDCFKDYFSADADYVITTNIDDDDALPVYYIQDMHDHVMESYKLKNLAPLKILAA
ncbi:MAG: hypothetical protein HRT89_08095, partial [Lentisphaeria bacterium]|nr:hypothetical protein [Lentisphaeria bacterium]